MILRKVPLHQAAHEHHRQLPLTGFEHIHHMHDIAAPVRRARLLKRKRQLRMIPRVGKRTGFPRESAGLIQGGVEPIQARRDRSPGFHLRPLPPIANFGSGNQRAQFLEARRPLGRSLQFPPPCIEWREEFRDPRKRQTCAGQLFAGFEIQLVAVGRGTESRHRHPQRRKQLSVIPTCQHRAHHPAKIRDRGLIDQRVKKIKPGRDSESRECGLKRGPIRFARAQNHAHFPERPSGRSLIQNAARDLFYFAIGRGRSEFLDSGVAAAFV